MSRCTEFFAYSRIPRSGKRAASLSQVNWPIRETSFELVMASGEHFTQEMMLRTSGRRLGFEFVAEFASVKESLR